MSKPYFVILAGPNGAGKTTFARSNLPDFIDSKAFLNADEIAAGLRPDDVSAVAFNAGRRLLEERKRHLSLGQSFCVETTLATRTLMSFVREAALAGFRTRLIFLFTLFPQLNELRVKQRVMAGGHNIDTPTIHRRHRGGLKNLADYWDACDEGVVFDARTESPLETLVKDERGTRVMSRFGWMWLRLRLQALDARVPTIVAE